MDMVVGLITLFNFVDYGYIAGVGFIVLFFFSLKYGLEEYLNH